MRMRTPIVRAASTKPPAAIVFPEAVGWRKRKRRTAPGSSGSDRGLAALVLLVGERLLELLVLLGTSSAERPVAVLLVLLVAGDELGEHARERVDLVAAELCARGEPRRVVGEHALEAEHERVADFPVGGGRSAARLHLGQGVVERPAARPALGQHFGRILVRGGGRPLRPTLPLGGRTAVKASTSSDATVGCSIASCMRAAPTRCRVKRGCGALQGRAHGLNISKRRGERAVSG